jgi:hypothetical protein
VTSHKEEEAAWRQPGGGAQGGGSGLVKAAWWRRPGGSCQVALRLWLAEAKKNQALITMLEERNSCGIG